MDQFDNLFDYGENNGLDIALTADNHLFNNGPDLFEEELAGRLREAINTPHEPLPCPNDVFPEQPPLASADSASFDPSHNIFQDIRFGDGQMNPEPLPYQSIPQPVAQQAGDVEFGRLTIAQALSQQACMQVPNVAPTAVLDNNTMQPQMEPGSVPAPNDLFMWGSIGTNNSTQMPGNGQQQQWPVFANQQTQLHHPQPNVAQAQYMQALRQFQFAQTQLALSMPASFQLPLNAQPPPNEQSLQAPQQSLQAPQQSLQAPQQSLQAPQQSLQAPQQSPPNEQVLQAPQQSLQDPQQSPPNEQVLQAPQQPHKSSQPYQEPELAQHVQELPQDSPNTTPADATPPEAIPSSPPVQQIVVSPPSEQEEPQSPRRPRKAPGNRKSNPAQGPHTPEQPQSRLTFTSLRDAEASMPERYLEKNWRSPNPDDTVPQTDEERDHWVVKMLKAMQDTSKCKDNKDGFSFLKRWRHADYYNVQEMEKVCWHMLDIAERLHAEGPSATNIYCQDAHKKMYASRNLTFEQRIIAICDMLKLSKFLCDNLMKGEGIEALVGAPKQKMSGAKTMHVQNLKRQNWLETGRRKDTDHSKGETDIPEDDGQDAVVNTADVPEPARRKPKQKSKRSVPAAKPRTRTNTRRRAPTPEDSDEGEDKGLSRRQSNADKVVNKSDHTVSPTPTPSPTPAPKRNPGARGRDHGQTLPQQTSSRMGTNVKPDVMPRKRVIDLTGSDSDEMPSARVFKRARGNSTWTHYFPTRTKSTSWLLARAEEIAKRKIAASKMDVDEPSQDEAADQAGEEKKEAEGDEEDESSEESEESEVETRGPSTTRKAKSTTSPSEESEVSESEAESNQHDTEAETDDDDNNDDGSNDEGSNDEGSNDEGSNDEGSNDEGSNDEGSNDEGSDDEGSDDEDSEDSDDSSESEQESSEESSDSGSDSDSDFEPPVSPRARIRKRPTTTAPATPTITKRKRDTIPKGGRLILDQPRVVEIDPSSESDSSESGYSASREDSAPPAKRAKKGDDDSARKSTAPASSAKNKPGRKPSKRPFNKRR
ncbi:hypothetical protein EKO04_011436 [Ascochyta lentis]|uniref:Uncharacterized protein n=1 Tax=Ascochyta lentis TaxID=205686 RepID=A0A8H7IUA2_9PLEO|nr:hypothetical protein EKO04_011436 [Ascochyta lentis]